jgi:hypothetical protein
MLGLRDRGLGGIDSGMDYLPHPVSRHKSVITFQRERKSKDAQDHHPLYQNTCTLVRQV